MVGPIRGRRLAAETKLELTRAVLEAKTYGMATGRACGILQLDERRLQRWLTKAQVAPKGPHTRPPAGGPEAATQRPVSRPDPMCLSVEAFVDASPVAKVAPHRLTAAELSGTARRVAR